jgi:hypothetical protein
MAITRRSLTALQMRVILENSYAIAMLSEILHNSTLKTLIRGVAKRVNEAILQPIKTAFSNPPEKLPDEIKGSLEYLIREHSSDLLQHHGLFKKFTQPEIKSDPSKIKSLLNTLEHYLLHQVDEAKTIDDMVKALKTICEMGFCYVEKFPARAKSATFATRYSLMMPTEQELDTRLKYEDVGLKTRFACTLGISQEPHDFVDDIKDEKAKLCGKSVFATISLSTYIKKLTHDYDATKNQLLGDEKKPEEKETKLELSKETKALQLKLETLTKKMNFYKIPLETSERKVLPKPTSLEQQSVLATGSSDPLPLVAGVSNTLARTLLTLYDLNVFKCGAKIDFEKSLMISNCLSATLIYLGHHSFLEVAEVYNRLLDCIGIISLESKEPAIASETIHWQWPCLQIGKDGYGLFYHSSYSTTVLNNAEEIAAIEREKLTLSS